MPIVGARCDPTMRSGANSKPHKSRDHTSFRTRCRRWLSEAPRTHESDANLAGHGAAQGKCL